MLQNYRSALEAAAASGSEKIQRDVIYAMHVLRYAGGALANDSAFGLGASSYLRGGTGLTGIPELDEIRLPGSDNIVANDIATEETKAEEEETTTVTVVTTTTTTTVDGEEVTTTTE